MERYSVHDEYMTPSEHGNVVLYADAQRALDVEREKVKRLSTCGTDHSTPWWQVKCEDLEAQLATLQAQLRQVEGERAKWEDIAGLRFAGDHKFVKEMELLKVENTALRQLVRGYFKARSGNDQNEYVQAYAALKATLDAQDAGKETDNGV